MERAEVAPVPRKLKTSVFTGRLRTELKTGCMYVVISTYMQPVFSLIPERFYSTFDVFLYDFHHLGRLIGDESSGACMEQFETGILIVRVFEIDGNVQLS